LRSCVSRNVNATEGLPIHAVSARCRFGKPLPQLSFVATLGADSAQISPLTRHAEERGEIVEGDQSISVNEMPDREHDGCDTGGPNQLAFEVRDRRRTGIAAGRDRPLLVLAANAPGQNCASLAACARSALRNHRRYRGFGRIDD